LAPAPAALRRAQRTGSLRRLPDGAPAEYGRIDPVFAGWPRFDHARPARMGLCRRRRQKAGRPMSEPVWFWQRIVSPHMAGLAVALVEFGRVVSYIAEREMSADRAGMGWQAPPLGKARLRLAPDAAAVAAAVRDAPEAAIHICQGFRGNGLIG